MPEKNARVEEFQVTGEKLLTTLKDLVHQGNVRRISIRSAKGVTLLEIPLVLGIAGAVFVPVWAAVGALAALVAQCTLVIERVEGEASKPATSGAKASKASGRRAAPKKKAPRSKAA